MKHDHGHHHDHNHGHEHPHTHDDDLSGEVADQPLIEGLSLHEAHDHEHHHAHAHSTGANLAHESSAEGMPHGHSCFDIAQLKVLETNIDDLNPETYEYVMDQLFAAGALDVFMIPIQMKKNRPATLLRVLCRPDDVDAMTGILFAETSTLGIREQTVERHALPRTIKRVETSYGAVRVKIADLGEGKVKWAPEYEDCRRLASSSGEPLRVVYQAAQEAARRAFGA